MSGRRQSPLAAAAADAAAIAAGLDDGIRRAKAFGERVAYLELDRIEALHETAARLTAALTELDKAPAK